MPAPASLVPTILIFLFLFALDRARANSSKALDEAIAKGWTAVDMAKEHGVTLGAAAIPH